MTEKSIDSILNEQRRFAPAAEFSAAAVFSAADLESMYAAAAEDSPAYWAGLARSLLSWDTPFETVLDDSKAPNYRWFTDGELNVSRNCLDVHLAERGDKTAIIFEGEGGDKRKLSYAQLTADVCRFANALRSQGIGPGDRVVIYMPMVPEAVIAMQACARIGAVHSVVFGGFSANSLRDRIEDAGAKMVITADGGHRGGKIVELKAATDKALEQGCESINTVIVLKRADCGCPMQSGRDLWWSDVIAGQADSCEPVALNAEHPLFLLYTSGSTGKPKGIQHASAGYLLHAKLTNQMDFRSARGRRVLVHGRCRLDYRPHLCRLRSAGGRRHHCHVRRRADLPRWRALLEYLPAAWCDDVLHRADGDPGVNEAWR